MSFIERTKECVDDFLRHLGHESPDDMRMVLFHIVAAAERAVASGNHPEDERRQIFQELDQLKSKYLQEIERGEFS